MLIGLALSKSVEETHPNDQISNFAQPSMSTKNNMESPIRPDPFPVSVSQERAVNERIVENLFPAKDDSPVENTPQFHESMLSKKYSNPNHASLHKKQVTTIWKSTPPRSKKKLDTSSEPPANPPSHDQLPSRDHFPPPNPPSTTNDPVLISSSPVDSIPSSSPNAAIKETENVTTISPPSKVPSNPTDFSAELKHVLSEYQVECAKQKDIFLHKLEVLKQSYFSAVISPLLILMIQSHTNLIHIIRLEN